MLAIRYPLSLSLFAIHRRRRHRIHPYDEDDRQLRGGGLLLDLGNGTGNHHHQSSLLLGCCFFPLLPPLQNGPLSNMLA